MKFTIGLVSYFEEHGYATDHWRKSEDGLLALVHDKYAEILIDLEDTDNVRTYHIDDEEFKQILADKFTPQPEEEVEED